MDGPGGTTLSEISQTKKANTACAITYLWNLKNKTNEYNETEIDSQGIEIKLVATSGEREGGIQQEEKFKRYKHIYTISRAKRILLCSTENRANVL